MRKAQFGVHCLPPGLRNYIAGYACLAAPVFLQIDLRCLPGVGQESIVPRFSGVRDNMPPTQGCFCEAFANKRLIFLRVNRSPQVIEGKGEILLPLLKIE